MDEAIHAGAGGQTKGFAGGVSAEKATSRALKLVPESDEVKTLRDEVVTILGLKPNRACPICKSSDA